jgi:hypothetical protein
LSEPYDLAPRAGVTATATTSIDVRTRRT